MNSQRKFSIRADLEKQKAENDDFQQSKEGDASNKGSAQDKAVSTWEQFRKRLVWF